MNYIINMRFDENGFYDLAGKDWQDYNVTYEEAGVFGNRCGYFNGASKILAEADEKLNLGTKDFTFSCWVKRSVARWCGLIGETSPSYTSGFILTGKSGSRLLPPAVVINNTWQTALYGKTVAPTDNEWHHMALVRKDGVFKFFMDGKLHITDVNSQFINANYDLGKKGTILGDTGYGGANNYHGLLGYMDDIVLVDKALWTEEFEPPKDYLGDETGTGNPEEPKPGVCSNTPAGAVMYFAMPKAPEGWLECDGSEVSQATYPKLYAAIGDIFGKPNDSNNFKLPDLRGEFIRSFDNQRGVDANRAFGSAQLDALQDHTHGSVVATVTKTASSLPAARVADETRPRNVALLACIKY